MLAQLDVEEKFPRCKNRSHRLLYDESVALSMLAKDGWVELDAAFARKFATLCRRNESYRQWLEIGGQIVPSKEQERQHFEKRVMEHYQLYLDDEPTFLNQASLRVLKRYGFKLPEINKKGTNEEKEAVSVKL